MTVNHQNKFPITFSVISFYTNMADVFAECESPLRVKEMEKKRRKPRVWGVKVTTIFYTFLIASFVVNGLSRQESLPDIRKPIGFYGTIILAAICVICLVVLAIDMFDSSSATYRSSSSDISLNLTPEPIHENQLPLKPPRRKYVKNSSSGELPNGSGICGDFELSPLV
ncbi:uncharacterized protein LOC118193706 [Stegodyphus dumicola]|uniref:uncharacterized protein LOC118193706 n=1 Tax=Stegodyphus dumicola TaxID=202533 RepID=UPI0015A9F55B|nr:uncharacterized protein LOC118193706 [Stegodyphus dumicola]